MTRTTFSSHPLHRLAWLGALVAVLGFQLYHLYGLHVSKDLPLWDESAYIGWGDEFLQDGKVGSITNAPAYHLLYAAIIRFAGVLPSFFVTQYLLKLTLTALFFWLCFRFSRSLAFSVLLSAFFACSYFHLNIDVLVYYGALIPFIAAILTAQRAPAVSLGLSFLAGLVRLEYMAVPLVHAAYLIWMRFRHKRLERQEGAASEGWRPAHAVMAIGLWAFNGWVLTRITVWQFHNRVWFAWSQNYAFFRYLTGRDSGGNPWLDHQTIAERDFPGAHSLAEAFAVNPAGVLEHTWFNLRELPGYLAQFLLAHQNASPWQGAPVAVAALLCLLGAGALVCLRQRRAQAAGWLEDKTIEVVLCGAGVVSAAPGAIVSSKTNYIMALVPAAVAALAAAHRLAATWPWFARWQPRVYGALAVVFAVATFMMPPAYTSRARPGPVFEDVSTMRTVLRPFTGLKILGVSTASYVNYLGRANGHKFIEPLAISPVNQQAADLSLNGLIRTHEPDVLLINSHWRSSASYETAMRGFSDEGWERHALRDGDLYLRAGLHLRPRFDERWFPEERLGDLSWHWSRGNAGIAMDNAVQRPVLLRFRMRSLVAREISISLNGTVLISTRLPANEHRTIEIPLPCLPAGRNLLKFESAEPAVKPGADDDRLLAFTVEGWSARYGHGSAPRTP